MTRHRLTGSKIALGRLCLWWARPDVDVPASDTSRAATLGTSVHSVAEAEVDYDEGRVDAAFRALMVEGAAEGLSESERRALEKLCSVWRDWQASADMSGAETEVAYAVDPFAGTARVLEQTDARDYSMCTATEIPATADVVYAAGGEAVVADYKTGRAPHRLADHLDQLTHLATAELLTEPALRSVQREIVHLTPEGAKVERRRLRRLEIETHLADMRALLERLPTATPAPGLHCEEQWCPAKAVCPATRALLLDAHLELEPRRRLPVIGPIASNDQALAVLVAAPLLEAWIAERVKEAKRYATEQGGIRAPDGRVYRGRTETRETPRLDVAGSLDVLRSVLGAASEVAIKTKVSTTWDAIGDAAKSAGLAVKDTKDLVRAALREMGALKVSEFEKFGWKEERKQ